MSAPKPPFHSTTEELLYNILLKLPDVTYLTANDVNSIAKLNALILDGDIPSEQSTTSAVESIRGNVPEAGNTLAKLYSIIQGLGNLKSEDIDTLAELNAILKDADLATFADIEETLVGINDGVPLEGSTLRKLYELINTKQNKFGSTFPGTYFVSPTGNNQTGVKGDFSKPFTPAGALGLAVAGETITFLPGSYVINSSIARNGVTYTTLGGKATITVNQLNAVVYNFDALPESALNVTIAGDFDYIIQNGGTVFNFKAGNTLRSYVVRWANAFQSDGVFMKMPTVFSTGIFEGNIEIDTTSSKVAIECRTTAATSGAGVMNLQITNKSLTTFAIKPWFIGFRFNISYTGNNYGLFSQPLNAGSDNNVFVLNIKQADACVTYLTSGEYSGSMLGGQINLFSGSINMNARLTNCILYTSPQTSSRVTALANNVVIINDQVTVLELHGTWRSCGYSRTASNLCILAGQFYNFQFNSSVGILKITGYVRLVDTTTVPVYANEYLEISGKLVGKAVQVIQLGQRSPVVISGYVKQLEQFAPAIKSAGGGYTHLLILKGAVIESGSSSPDGIRVDAPDGIELKLYGKCYGNKRIAGTGVVTYLVGASDDLVVGVDVNVIDA
jgi:hypothetical protein